MKKNDVAFFGQGYCGWGTVTDLLVELKEIIYT
jgi:hypothetical protein